MAYLYILEGPDKGKKLTLKAGVNIVGKDASKANLVLTDPAVSRIHARITVNSSLRSTIEDLNSKNGTIVRNKKITGLTEITPGEIIQIGHCLLKLETERTRENANGASTEGTSLLPPENFTRYLDLSPGVINIGRDPSNDIIISHPIVSRFHARIITINNSCQLIDLGSSNGTFVNGKQVRKPVDLLPGFLVQIASNSYFFDGKQLTEFDESSGQIKLEVKNLEKSIPLAKGNKKKLLDQLNFEISPREFVAILGGSGAGKSTLLGSLTGIKPASSGDILINGRSLYKNYDSFRSIVGYVPQDDIVHFELTVREVLTYSARLRLPDDLSKAELNSRVEEVLTELELNQHQNTLVKDLSGGQRKRVSIGVELLTKPSLFFLDEPTSGLDPGLEKIMMELFRKLSDQGRTIVLVTHATFNIDLCDKVIFLTAGGKLAFFGSPKECLKYFKAKDFAEIYKKLETEQSPQRWAQSFDQFSLGSKNLRSKQLASSSEEFSNHVNLKPNTKNKSSPLLQLKILTERYARTITRDRKNLTILLIQPIIIALLVVMVFAHDSPLFRNSDYEVTDLIITEEVIASGQLEEVQTRNEEEATRRKNMSTSVAIMIITAIWFGTSNASREIVKELPIYRRERLVKLRILPYLLSKVSILALICLVQTILFITIISLSLRLPGFGFTLLAFFLVSLASLMMGLAVSAAVSNTDKAVSTVPILLIPQILLSGAFVQESEVQPEFLQHVFKLAISKWGYQLVGGGVADINGRVALEKPLEVLQGDFTINWRVLISFILAFFLFSIYTLKKKDSRLE